MSAEPHIGQYDLDDALLEQVRRTGRPQLRFYRVDRTLVVLGRGSKPEVEVNIEACTADRVPILRRRGGGCAVVLDPGNVIVSVALPIAGLGDNQRHMRAISAWLIETLAAIGIDGVTQDGISDLVFDGRKVSGACIYRARDLLYYSATLLVDANLARIARYLKHPPREPDYRAGRTHGDFVGRLTAPELETAARLESALQRGHGLPALDRLLVH